MRNEKELLKLMLEHKDRFLSGLCLWVSEMYMNDIITYQEAVLLQNYINGNRPFWNRFFKGDISFWWKKGQIKPRIKWINKHIKKLSK